MLCEIISSQIDGVGAAVLTVARAYNISTSGKFSSDATICFTRGSNSRKLARIRDLTKQARKPYYEVTVIPSSKSSSTESKVGGIVVNPRDNSSSAESVARWIVKHNISVLNIEGDAEDVSPGMKDEVESFMTEVLEELRTKNQLIKNSQDCASLLTKLRIPYVLCEVISGLTNDAELAGLEAAREKGLITGGCYSSRVADERGKLIDSYGLLAGRVSSLYNYLSDATICFTRYPNSQSSKRTRAACATAGKPLCEVFVNSQDNPWNSEKVAQWIVENNVSVLNVTGDNEEKSPGIKDYVKTFLFELFAELNKRGKRFDQPNDRRIWLARFRSSQSTSSGNVCSYTRFVYAPSEETLYPLLRTVSSLISDVYEALKKQRGEILMSDQIRYNRAFFDCRGYLETHLKSYVNPEIENPLSNRRGLTEGYSSLDKKQDFELYVTSLALFHLWNAAESMEDRAYFSALLRYSFEPHLERYLNQKRRNSSNKFEEYIQDEALRKFLDEELGYLTKINEISYAKLRGYLEKRLGKWRAPSVAKQKSVKRRMAYEEVGLYSNNDKELSGSGFLRLRNSVVDRSPRVAESSDDAQAEEFERQTVVADELYGVACNAAAKFENTKGRRLFLLMMLGGLSHKKKCSKRCKSDSTKYLVQSELVCVLLNEDRNFINHWFKRELNDKIDWDVLLEKVKDTLELEELSSLRDGWRVFVGISDCVMDRIQIGTLSPNAVGIKKVDWPRRFNSTLTNLHAKTNDEQRQRIIANFTKYVCENAKGSENGWNHCLEEFSKLHEQV